MLADLKGFDWDLHNVGHIDRHGIGPSEVEQVFKQPHVVIPGRNVGPEARWMLFGKTQAGRYLVVVFTIRNNRLRTVTAYAMNQRERKIYGSQIDKPS